RMPGLVEEIDDLVPRDGIEPRAEAAALRIVDKLASGPDDAAQHVLRDVGRVGVLQTLSPRIAIDKRRVSIDKLCPRAGIGQIANLNEQAVTRCKRIGHSAIIAS